MTHCSENAQAPRAHRVEPFSRHIVGFSALRAYTQLSECLIRRAFKLYGFPAHVEVRDGQAPRRVWNKDQVLDWLIENRHRKGYSKAMTEKILLATTFGCSGLTPIDSLGQHSDIGERQASLTLKGGNVNKLPVDGD